MAENANLIPVDALPPERQAHGGYPAFDVEPSGLDRFTFHTYWEILRKRKVTIITVALITTSVVTLGVFRMKPVYRATARMEVRAETPQLQNVNDLNATGINDYTFLQTQVELLQNNNLIWETIQGLGLANAPGFSPPAKDSAAKTDNPPAAVQAALIGGFKGGLHVALLNNSRLIEVSYESVDPDLAARVANTLISNHVEQNFRSRYDATRQASVWMEQQLDELKAKVEKNQQALVDYEREYSIANIGDKQNVVQQRLAQLSNDLTTAEVDRANKQSVYDTVRSHPSDATLVAGSALFQQLDAKYSELQTEYAATTAQYGPNFSKVKQLHNQLLEVESLLDRERKRITEHIDSDYRTAVRREQLLAQEVARQKSEVEKLNQLLIQYNLLKNEYETNQQLYNDLLKRLKDATVSVSLGSTNVRLADEALVPTSPIRPNRRMDISVAIISGLLLGVTLAFIQESLDRSIKSAEDIEREIAVPTLAVVPRGVRSGGLYSRYFSREAEKANGNGNAALAVLNAPGSEMAECFRVLRTSILLSTAPRPPQVLLVTSAHAGEGKTCTAANLALGLAQRGSRVVIVDSDIRKQGVSRVLGFPFGAAAGLSSLLTGGYDIEQALQPYPALPNLWVLPAGPAPPNPAELLSSPAMGELLRDLRQRFDHVVLDSPPLLLLTDGVILAAMADGVVLVVESGVTSRSALSRVRRILDRAGAKTLGASLNKLDHRLDGYYSSRYHYYGYYYSNEHKTAPAAGKDSAQAPPPALLGR
jgi:capsular exopolysaccharide synthesis family protein